MAKPNILLLTTDQQRFDTIAAMGYPYMITPNLDRLVGEGCGWSTAHSTNPACIPARHNLLTGQLARVTRLDDNYFNGERMMPRSIPTLPGVLSDNGYETVAVGKMHFLPTRNHNGFGRMEIMEEIPRYREDDDYALWLDSVGEGEIKSLHGVRNLLYMIPQTPLQQEEHTATVWVADRLIHHLKSNAGNRPFFYWGSWIAPHPPLSVPRRYADLYAGKTLPKTLPPKPDPKPLTAQNAWIGDFYDEQVARRAREYYYGAITWVDEQIGRVLAALEEIGQLDNTLIAFTSDHGELLGDHGSYQKFQPYEGSVRVPLVMRWPGHIAPGSRREDFADLCDLFPTFLAAAGLPCPDGLSYPGGDLLAESGSNRPYQYVECNHGPRRWISLRDRRYKYIYYYAGGQEELFDLTADPDEQHNLIGAPDPAARQAHRRLREQLTAHEARWGLEDCVENGSLKALEPITIPPRLPASFPVFHKWAPDAGRFLSNAEEIRRATAADEPSVRLEALRWEDWIGQGLLPESLREELLGADAQQGSRQVFAAAEDLHKR